MHPNLLSHMFVLGVPLLEKILRPILVYAFLIIGLRLAGKRELAQLNTFDLVVLLTISNTVQNAIIGDDNTVSGGLIGATTLLVVNYLVARLLYGHTGLDWWVEGGPVVLMEHGKIRQEALRRELITIAELKTAVHKQGFGSLDEVEKAVIEPGGTISFTARTPSKESTRHDEVMARLEELSQQVSLLTHAAPAS